MRSTSPVDGHRARLGFDLAVVHLVQVTPVFETQHLYLADVADPEVGVQRLADGDVFVTAVFRDQLDLERFAHGDIDAEME